MGFRPPKILVFLIAVVSLIIGHCLIYGSVYAAHDEVFADPGVVKTISVPSVQSAPVPAQEKEYVIRMEMLTYKVKNGDNLTQIAKTFGVTKSALLSSDINPTLAKRNRPDLIKKGETIWIPVYRIEEGLKVDSSLLLGRMVMMSSIDLLFERADYKERIYQLTEDNKAFQSRYKFELALIIILVLLALGAFIWGSVQYSENIRMRGIISVTETLFKESLKEGLKKAAPVSFANSSPEEVLEVIRTAKGMTLEKMNDLPLVHDETGSPTTLKKVREFMEKNRDYLSNLPVNQWEEAMKAVKMNSRSAENDPAESRKERMRSAETGD